MLEEFSKRIKTLRKEKGKTQKEVAEGARILPATYSRYEVGERLPTVDILNNIADYYGVTTDYLLGRTNIKTPEIETRAACEMLGLSETVLNLLAKKSKLESSNEVFSTLIMNFLVTYQPSIKLLAKKLYLAKKLDDIYKQKTYTDDFEEESVGDYYEKKHYGGKESFLEFVIDISKRNGLVFSKEFVEYEQYNTAMTIMNSFMLPYFNDKNFTEACDAYIENLINLYHFCKDDENEINDYDNQDELIEKLQREDVKLYNALINL